MDFLQGLHSGLRWLLLLFLVVAIINAFNRKRGSLTYGTKDKLLNLLVLILMHTQVLIGFILYFGRESYKGFSHMDVTPVRFFAIEHLFGMLVAAVIITMGRKQAEKSESPGTKHRKIFVWYLVALIIILLSIPWPFREGFERLGWF